MNAPVDTSPETRDYILDTYRYLRGGMAVIIVMLGAAVIGERLAATCWQTSISAYYYTTAHGIFIATLCALGAQLIVYKGSSDTEDVLLNLAGILAFIVAVVPTGRPASMCGAHDLPTYDPHHAITNNAWAVVVALVAAQLVAWLLYWRMGPRRNKSLFGTVSTGILWLVVALGLVALIFFRRWFDSHAHGVAAVIMFLAIIITVWATAFLVSRQDEEKSRHRHRYYVLYQAIAVTMLATLVGVVVLHLAMHRWPYWVIVVETALILEFAAYWVIQTIELWHTPTRIELLPEEEQPMLVQGRSERGAKSVLTEVIEAAKVPRGEKLLRGETLLRAL